MRKSRYYEVGIDLKEHSSMEPELRELVEAERPRLRTRAVHALVTSKVRTLDELKALGYEGMLAIRWCGVKTATVIGDVLLGGWEKSSA